MKRTLLATTCLLAVPLAAQAGGLEKSGQPVTLLFEKGDIIQLDLAYGIPHVTGVNSRGSTAMTPPRTSCAMAAASRWTSTTSGPRR